MRLDIFLVQKKLANSRTQAKELIESGYVVCKNKSLKKSNLDITDDLAEQIEVLPNDLQKYVSRAGIKLEKAIKYLNLDVKNKKILDIGQSTGGFTDCLLQLRADLVVGVDVGTDQLVDKIKNHPNVKYFENLNVKDLAKNTLFLKTVPSDKFDLVVMDVSFISIEKVVEDIKPFLKQNAQYLFLVKPQFECTAADLNKNGIIKNEKIYTEIENRIKQKMLKVFGDVTQYFNSELSGKDGNREFFIYGKNISN